MSNEIKVVYESGNSLTYGIYYSNNGTMTMRDDTNPSCSDLTEEPEGSGLYVASPDTIAAKDIVIIYDGSTIVDYKEYLPDTILSSSGLNNILMEDMEQGAPSATATIVEALNFLYELGRNKVKTTAAEIAIYKDNGATKAFKATIADDGSSFTRYEMGSGE